MTMGAIQPKRGRTSLLMGYRPPGGVGMPPAQTMPILGSSVMPPASTMTQDPTDPRLRTHQLSVSQIMDPALNRRMNGPLNVTDAINSGMQVGGWASSSGLGPGTRGYRGADTDGDEIPDGHINAHIPRRGSYVARADGGPVKRAHGGPVHPSIQPKRGMDEFYKNNPTEAPAYMREATKILMNPRMKMPISPPTADTFPKRKAGGDVKGHHDTRAPMSRAGRTGGLTEHWNNQRNLALERGARGAVDPITGLSHTPTQAEINDQLAMLAEKPTEFPGYGGLEESLLLSDYYNAKQSGDRQALMEAAAAVQDFKNKLNALRAQKEQNQYVVNEEGEEAYQPEGGQPELIPGGEHVQSFPQDGKVIPADKTAQLAQKGQIAPPSPEIARAAQASEKVAPPLPKTEPSATPQGRTAQMMAERSIVTPYGTGSVTNAPRLTPSHINMTDEYDPNFAKKGAALDEASRFSAVQEPMPDTGEGSGFEAVTQSPQQAWQQQAGRTVQLMKEAKDRAAREKELNDVDVAMSKGKFTPGTSNLGYAGEPFGIKKMVSNAARSIGKILPAGAFGGR